MKKAILTLMAAIFMAGAYAQTPCERIHKEVDEFTGEVTIRTPYEKNFGFELPTNMTMYKFSGEDFDEATSYILRLTSVGSTLNYSTKGVIVLFTDGTKWEKPNEKVDVNYNSGGWTYSTWIELNEDDLEIFKTKIVSKWKLYIYQGAPKKQLARDFSDLVKCLTITE